MSQNDVYADGVLRKRWDDTARTYTEWDENGVQTFQRPYTDEENAAANEAEHAQEVAILQREQGAALAALTPSETNALLAATAPPPGSPWRQPTGAHDAYPLGAIVTHRAPAPPVPYNTPPVQYAEVPWESLVTANVWEPGVSGWRETGVEWPAWEQPAGTHDSYAIGAKVSHNSSNWVSDVDANVWEPGVYGWTPQP